MSFRTIFTIIYLSIGITSASASATLSMIPDKNARVTTVPGTIVFAGLTLLWPIFFAMVAYQTYNRYNEPPFQYQITHNFNPPTQQQLHQGTMILQQQNQFNDTIGDTEESQDESEASDGGN